MFDVLCVLCGAERNHSPSPVHEPALLPVESAEEAFLMETGSFDGVGVAYLHMQYLVFKVFCNM